MFAIYVWQTARRLIGADGKHVEFETEAGALSYKDSLGLFGQNCYIVNLDEGAQVESSNDVPFMGG